MTKHSSVPEVTNKRQNMYRYFSNACALFWDTNTISYKVKNDHRSKFSNLSNWEEEAWKKLRASTGFEPVTSAIPVRCYRRGHGLKPWFFQAPSFQLLKLENLLQWSFFTLIYNRSSNIWIISYMLHAISLLSGDMNSAKLTSLPMCGFIAQLVEHRTGIAEVTGSNPVEALIFSGFFFPIA